MPTRSRRRTTALAAAVATAAALGATAIATVGAPAASAAEEPLTGYELTWGIKESYRTYVTGAAAAGGFTPAEGAAQAEGNGAFTFVAGTGTYDSTAHTLELGFRGSLGIRSEAHGFHLTLADVRFDSADAVITADVTEDGTTTQDVPLAEVTVTRAMTDMATTLTKEAADVFGDAAFEGAEGDPLTVVQKKTTQSPSPTATGSPSTTPTQTPSATASATPTATPSQSATGRPSPTATGTVRPPTSPADPDAPVGAEIADGTLRWGVKKSFRAHVVGGAAHGRITVAAGATQAPGNGVFTFVDGKGTYDTGAGTLTAAFEGAVTFAADQPGGAYDLDLTLTDLTATLDEGTGELTADVTSLGDTTQDVVLARLTAGSAGPAVKNDVLAVADVAAELTDEGAEAFGGLYRAGTDLDPLDLSLALTEGADLPGGATATPSPTTATGGTGSTTGGAIGSTAGAVTGGLAATGSDVPVGTLGIAAAVSVVAGAGVVLAVRRRREA
ncbi:HtaA domain-containing protein [Streptomyces sp.]|uniref:HtaA domain-containing protein n=1 Tax=Streptomyces sp. TaxID=1931 RepID=UPI002D60F6BE|nr:HtaA domain-containing protein [Streptomyces sp.]HZF88766.1 HtaA domain-containing protein [Streptomyces sp.]